MGDDRGQEVRRLGFDDFAGVVHPVSARQYSNHTGGVYGLGNETFVGEVEQRLLSTLQCPDLSPVGFVFRYFNEGLLQSSALSLGGSGFLP